MDIGFVSQNHREFNQMLMDMLKEKYPLRLRYTVRRYDFVHVLPLSQHKLKEVFKIMSPCRLKRNAITFHHHKTTVIIHQKCMIVSGADDFLPHFTEITAKDAPLFELKPPRTVHEVFIAEHVDPSFIQQHFTLTYKDKCGLEFYQLNDARNITIRYWIRTSNISVSVTHFVDE